MTDTDALVQKIFQTLVNDTATFSVDRNNTQKTMAQYVGAHPQTGQPQIYRNEAAMGATFPVIVFRRLGGRARKGSGGKVVSWKHTYAIKLIDLKSNRTATKYAIQDRFQKLFQQDQGVLDTVVIGASIDDYLEYEEVKDGVEVDHIGIQCQFDTYNMDV